MHKAQTTSYLRAMRTPRTTRPLRNSSWTLGVLAALVFLCSTGCHGDTDFDVKQANDFAPSGRISVSVLGVMKDGLMSQETWESLGPKLSPALRSPKCDTRYDSAFVAENKGVASAVEDYTRANGVTEPLLTAFSTSAEGDVMMVLSVSGRASADTAPVSPGGGAQMPGLAPASGRQGGGTGNGYGGGFGNSSSPASPGFGRTSPSTPSTSTSVFEIAATFYSVREKKPVAQLSMKYTGPREEDAISRFAAKLHAYLPNATCVGFKKDSDLTEERVRQLPLAE